MGAGEQAAPQFLFDAMELHGESGLHDRQPLGGASDIGLLVEGQEGPAVFERQGRRQGRTGEACARAVDQRAQGSFEFLAQQVRDAGVVEAGDSDGGIERRFLEGRDVERIEQAGRHEDAGLRRPADLCEDLGQRTFGRIERSACHIGERRETWLERSGQARGVEAQPRQVGQGQWVALAAGRRALAYHQPTIGHQSGIGIPRQIGQAQRLTRCCRRIVGQQADSGKAPRCLFEHPIERRAWKAEGQAHGRNAGRSRIAAAEMVEDERRLQEHGTQLAVGVEAGAGDDLPALMATKMMVAELVGNRLGVRAHRRAADAQALGGAGDPAFFDQREERLDLRERDDRPRLVQFALAGLRRPHAGLVARLRPTVGRG